MRHTSTLSFALPLALIAMLAPSVAFADGPPVDESAAAIPDVVHLRGGGTFRGHVTEVVPGDHVTVTLGTGESRRVAWPEVDRLVIASAPVAVPSTAEPRARVHIRAPRPSYLYRRAAGTADFVTACETPCDAEMPIGDTYKIGGKGFRTTAEFTLDAEPGGQVDLAVDGPSWAGIVGGGALTLAGGFTAYVGLLVALAECRGDCGGQKTAGLGAMALGGAAMGLGLLIVFPSLKTDLSRQKDSPSKDAFLRTPTWRSASAALESNGLQTAFPLVYEGRF